MNDAPGPGPVTPPADQNQSQQVPQPPEPPKPEHIQIKVADANNEIYFKIKPTIALYKVMAVFCEKNGYKLDSVRFFFDGTRVNGRDTPESVSLIFHSLAGVRVGVKMEMKVMEKQG